MAPLDLLILRALRTGPNHGLGIAHRLELRGEKVLLARKPSPPAPVPSQPGLQESRTVNATSTRMLSPVTRSAAAV